MKYYYLLMAIIVVLNSCGQAAPSVQKPTATAVVATALVAPTPIGAPTTSTTSASEDMGPKPPHWDRVEYFSKIQIRIKEITDELGVEEISYLGDFLQKCMILFPVALGGEVIKPASGNCAVVIVTEAEAREYPENWGYFWNSNSFANYDPTSGAFSLRMEGAGGEELSLDYLAAVMLHEAVHAFQYRCAFGNYECKAKVEAEAYTIEFVVMDFLASKKNPNYQDFLQKKSAKLYASYVKGDVEFPDYSNSEWVREYFDSNSQRQDRLWDSVHFLKQYQDMLVRKYGGIEGSQRFELFLTDLYKQGAI